MTQVPPEMTMSYLEYLELEMWPLRMEILEADMPEDIKKKLRRFIDLTDYRHGRMKHEMIAPWPR